MTGKFAGLKAAFETDSPENALELPEISQPQPAVTKPTKPKSALPGDSQETADPWTLNPQSHEQVKILNGRVPRSVRLDFGRQLTDAMDAMNEDLTLDIAVEAIARLVIEDEEVRRKWKHRMWELRRSSR